MAQHDQVLADAVGAAFRADANAALAALFSNNSGATAPATTVPGLTWADTSGSEIVYKIRDAADTGWIVLPLQKSSADIASAATVDLTAIGVVGMSAAAITGTTATSAFTMNDGQHMTLVAVGAWPLTYHATTCKIITGGSYICSAGEPVHVFKTGGVVYVEPIFIGPKAAPAGTIIQFAGTAVPSGYLQCPTAVTNISRTTYAALFAAIGTTWGAGDGSTTFGIPFFPADYSLSQAVANVGTQTTGVVKSHQHDIRPDTAAGGVQYSPLGITNGVLGATTFPTNLFGGAANLAAGSRVMFCVKY
ncbi:MAG: phage tail protein [Sideroxydans sp.]|jgi:hypothetical protein